MKKDVLITLKGSQEYIPFEMENKIEFFTEGKYYKKGEAYFLTYKESEITGFKGTTTTFRIQPNLLTLIRFGGVNSSLVFEEGKRHMSVYQTEEGTLMIGVFTKQMMIDIDDDGGKIYVNYYIDFENTQAVNNYFHLEIKKVGGRN